MTNIRTQAESDLAFILEDGAFGAAWDLILTDPNGFTSEEPLQGFSSDIGDAIDPDTGQAISGRLVTVSLRISSVLAAGYSEIPQEITSSGMKPWVIKFVDLQGQQWAFKVKWSAPDRTIGIVTCHLELYKT